MRSRRHDPLANPEPLIRDVYAYVSYRVANGSDAEEVTSSVFERAVRYRDSYDPGKGTPIKWLIGIARTQIAQLHAQHDSTIDVEATELADGSDIEGASLERLTLQEAVGSLDDRSRELIALRYGIGLSSREIAAELGMQANVVDVALHRARGRLRRALTSEGAARPPRRRA
jgi:RNA polymerase sigma-70 factor, ECF subfamily